MIGSAELTQTYNNKHSQRILLLSRYVTLMQILCMDASAKSEILSRSRITQGIFLLDDSDFLHTQRRMDWMGDFQQQTITIGTTFRANKPEITSDCGAVEPAHITVYHLEQERNIYNAYIMYIYTYNQDASLYGFPKQIGRVYYNILQLVTGIQFNYLIIV